MLGTFPTPVCQICVPYSDQAMLISPTTLLSGTWTHLKTNYPEFSAGILALISQCLLSPDFSGDASSWTFGDQSIQHLVMDALSPTRSPNCYGNYTQQPPQQGSTPGFHRINRLERDSSTQSFLLIALQLKLGASEEGPWTERSLGNYFLTI